MKSTDKTWKERFAEDLLKIRRKVREEKLLAARAAADEVFAPCVTRKDVRKRAPSTKAAARAKRRSRYFTDASYAAALRRWWNSQGRFTRQADLAALISVDLETFSSWLNSRKFPRGRYCNKLFAITELECFSPAGQKAARREHRAKKVKR